MTDILDNFLEFRHDISEEAFAYSKP